MGKAVLRRAYEADLGVRFEERQKRAMPSSPYPHWLKEATAKGLDRLADSGVVQPAYARGLAERYRGRQDRKTAWLLLVLHRWLERFVFGRDPFDALV